MTRPAEPTTFFGVSESRRRFQPKSAASMRGLLIAFTALLVPATHTGVSAASPDTARFRFGIRLGAIGPHLLNPRYIKTSLTVGGSAAVLQRSQSWPNHDNLLKMRVEAVQAIGWERLQAIIASSPRDTFGRPTTNVDMGRSPEGNEIYGEP